jgi:hypothetical protein
MEEAVGSAIAKGLAYLRAAQQDDGGFDTFYSPTKKPFRAQKPYRTMFLPALVLGALGHVAEAQDIRTPLATWLQAQRSPEWSFNYWPLNAPGRSERAYPDDLDDTACILAGLWLHDPKLVSPAVLGKAVRLLLATETAVGGPYRTWLVPPDAPAIWLDTDLAVNANIAYFLRLVAQPLPNLTALMEQAITGKAFASPYYPSAYPLLYYLGRAYRGERQQTLVACIMELRKPAGHWGTPLQTALALGALHEQGETNGLEAAVTYLLGKQRPDGSWPAEPFWLEVEQTYSGAPALTTALVLEALERYSQKPAEHASHRPSRDRMGDQLYKQITAEATSQFSMLDETLRRQANTTLERMMAGDHNREIMLLPYYFAQSLQIGGAEHEVLLRLGLASLYGWTAYTIYDDFLDASGDVRLLPLANVALRSSVQEFRRAVPGSHTFQEFVAHTFDIIDGANAWEVTHCRFSVFDQQVGIGPLPDYGALERLAERSLGHALTPLGVLAALGMPPNDPKSQLLLSALRHYLIARQLGDDMHDWEPDLRAGQCSYVIARILADLHIGPGTYPLTELVPRMQQEAWSHTLETIGILLLRHISLARRDLTKSALMRQNSLVAGLLDGLEAATKRTLQEQADAESFLAAYKTPGT